MLDATPALTHSGMRLTVKAARLPDWLGFDRRDLGLAVTLAAATTVIDASGSFFLLRERSPLQVAEFIGTVFLDQIIVYVAMVWALEMAERLPILGWRRHLTTIAVSVAVSMLISGPQYFLGWPYAPGGLTYGIANSPLALLLNRIWECIAMALIARAWLVRSHEETDASNLLARMRSEQMSVRRRLVEGRLKAIQARVDPLFFFAMLDAVQRTYVTNRDRAEQLLDELTAFLRAALPRLRTASSSVNQECDLARSFARLRALAGLGKSTLEIDIEPSIGSASFPPGVLLPLIDELLRATGDSGSVGIYFSTVDVGTDVKRLALPVTDGAQTESVPRTLVMQLTAPTTPSFQALAESRATLLDVPGAIADARATLLDLFGVSADLTSIAADGGVRTTVRVPYEPASA